MAEEVETEEWRKYPGETAQDAFILYGESGLRDWLWREVERSVKAKLEELLTDEEKQGMVGEA